MATQIPKEILQHIIDSGNDRVTIENDSFLTVLLAPGKKPLRFRVARFIGFALVFIFTLGFVLYSASFYVQNVLLHKVDLHTNPFGAFERKSFNSEYAMFLYDPAEAWAASGIQVQKGDILFIAGSGAYHTNYEKLIKATENNFWADVREKYVKNNLLDSFDAIRDTVFRYVDVTTPPEEVDPDDPKEIDLKNRKVNNPRGLDKTALFGDVLMQIIPETRLRLTDSLCPDRIYALPRLQISKKEPLKIEHDGMLTFGVNDNNPLNNVGQVLVAMEIYRKQTMRNAAWKILSGQFIDFPYYWYDYWLHRILDNSWWYWFVSLVFVLWVMAEYVLFCIILFFLPFLFIKDTWQPVIKLCKRMKKPHTLILVIALLGTMACTPKRPSYFVSQEELDTLCAWYERGDFKAFKAAFSDTLKFGTAGLRAPMNPGTNYMNALTVATATQGFANYLKKQNPNGGCRVVVGYDCRHNSKEFANIVADVFSANGIHVLLFEDMRPTPEISFAIRENQCVGGVNITASHNPKEYNGYKAYWSDGGQVVPPYDAAIVEKAKYVDMKNIKHQRVDSLVTIIGNDIDRVYADSAQKVLIDLDAAAKAKDLKIVYTPMHGAGYQIVPMCLKKMGVKHVSIVKAQLPDNGQFASVAGTDRHEANPEDEQAMELVFAQAQAEDADLAIATDPDADRFGFYCKDSKGAWHRIDGHQSTMLFTKYIIDTRTRLGKMPEKPFMGRTIVTSEIVKRIADEANIRMYDEYTGFKWIAHRIVSVRKDSTFIGAGEESFCYLPYDYARDKDAPASICLLAEMAASAKARGTTLWDDLMDIYRHYGFQREYTVKMKIEAENGQLWSYNQPLVMDLFRHHLKTIHGEAFTCLDYKDSTAFQSRNLPKAENTLQYFTAENNIKVTIRPSGTEPVLKAYVEVPDSRFRSAEDYEALQQDTHRIQEEIVRELKALLDNHGFIVTKINNKEV